MEDNNIIVSVIVPVYNVEIYLEQCIESILRQTFPSIEIILVDDGSTDSSGLLCDMFSTRDSRIRVIHKENGGLSSARNVAITIANGKYFSFIDSDDYVSPTFLEELVAAIQIENCDIGICNITTIDNCGRLNDGFYRPYLERMCIDNDEKFNSVEKPSACNKLFSRQLFNDISFPLGRLYEDLFVYYLLLESANKIVYTGSNLYYYRIRNDSISTSNYTIKSTDIIEGYYNQALFFTEKKIDKLAAYSFLWLYSRTAIAFSHLDSNDISNKAKLKEIKRMYNSCVPKMLQNKNYSFKQKIAMVLLFINPNLHEVFIKTKNRSNL